MPNHATCLHDRAGRLHDMSPIKHQASLGNSMYIYIYMYHHVFEPTIHMVEPSRNEWLNCDIVIRRPDRNNLSHFWRQLVAMTFRI